MRAFEFKKQWEAVTERDRFVVVVGKSYAVYANHFEIPYRMVGSHNEGDADISLFYNDIRVAYVKLKSVTSLQGVYS